MIRMWLLFSLSPHVFWWGSAALKLSILIMFKAGIFVMSNIGSQCWSNTLPLPQHSSVSPVFATWPTFCSLPEPSCFWNLRWHWVSSADCNTTGIGTLFSVIKVLKVHLLCCLICVFQDGSAKNTVPQTDNFYHMAGYTPN